MSIVSRYGLLLLVMLYPLVSLCQHMDEKLITTDAGDSLFIKAFHTTFDSSGNYYFETPLRGKGNKFSIVSNKKKFNTVYTGSGIATTPYKTVLADAFFSDTSHKKVYYKNREGTSVYGPHAGRVRELLEFGRNNIAMELCVGAKSYLYINDSLVNTVDDSLLQKWLCAFSDNGNCMYSIYKKGHYALYLNHELIDTSAYTFSDIAVNNSGFYIYAKQVAGKFYLHTPDKAFGPLGAIDGSDLWNNNAYYSHGCADSSCYVLVNGKLYNDIPESHSLVDDNTAELAYKSDEQITVELSDKDNSLFSYNKNDEDGIFTNLNGKVEKHNYTRTSYIFYNKGGYAFYGSRPDSFGIEHTYKNINGVEKKLPYFKKVPSHAQCMQIDPDGSDLYYYSTTDSIYMYRDDTLLCLPASKKKFYQWDATALPQAHPLGTEFFQGFNVTDRAYIMYNNTLSRPMPLINPEYSGWDVYKKGNVVAGDMNGTGFFIIVATAPGKYLLNINNTVYKDLEGIDRIFGEQSYFTANTLIFYGLKGSSFYQFKINF